MFFAVVGATLVWSGLVPWVTLKALNVMVGIRVGAADENEGLDLANQGVLGYSL